MITEYLLFGLCAVLALSPLFLVVLVANRLSGSVSGSVKLEEGRALSEARAQAANLRQQLEVLAPTVATKEPEEAQQ